VSRVLYWTILIGDEPTSFRAAEAAELKPTLVQLQRTNPDARLVWFERGRIWGSPAEAHAARLGERASARSRPSTWRPGGKHVDPRQKYKDAKKAKWTRFKEGIRKRAEDRRGDRPPPVREDAPRRSTKDILADWKPPPKTSEQPQKSPTFKPAFGKPRFDRKPEQERGEGRPPWRPKATLRQDSPRPWGKKPEGGRPERPTFGGKPGGKPGGTFARPKFDGPRPPRPRTRDDRGPRKPRKD
jgi:hypothetical protein